MSVDLYKLVIAAKLSKGDTPAPTGTLSITQNGTYDVTDYASADVQTPQPSGSISITQNGTVDVSQYASADVNVSGGGDSVLADLIEGDITALVIPDGPTKIRSYAFRGCTSLASITIPESVTSILAQAFYGCTSLASITIPESVTSILAQAFYNCSSLTNITVENLSPPSLNSSNIFEGVPATANIYVPSESVERYKSAPVWSARAAYIQAIPE